MADIQLNSVTLATESGGTVSLDSGVASIPAAGITGVLPVGVTGGSGLDAVVAGGLIKIGGASFTSVSTVALGVNLGTYRVHKLFLDPYYDSGSSSINLYLRVKIGGSWLATGGKYNWNQIGKRSSSTTVDGHSGESENEWKLTKDSMRSNTKSGWDITFHNLVNNTSVDFPCATALGTGVNHDGSSRNLSQFSALQINNTGEVTDIQFYPNTATIAGSWELYGLI